MKNTLLIGLAAASLLPPLAISSGTPVNLTPPLGLPPIYIPADNPLTQEKIDLGRQLFMDRRLSHNNVMSCAMCHVPEQAFTSHELGTAIGLQGRSLRRNSPTIINVGYQRSLFHEGRELHLEDQIWSPLLAKNEMDMPSVGYVVEKVKMLPEYKGRFEATFGGEATAQRLGFALASYQRSMISGNSRFDRWYYGGEKNALNAGERRGFEVFRGKARCIVCHTVGEKYALFTDHKFYNTGHGWLRSMAPEKASYRVQVAPGEFVEVGSQHLDPFEKPLPDVGRYEVTLDPKDRWAYKTPSLRNVAITAPYMHDGGFPTLETVVDFYNKGGIDNPDKTPLIVPLNLTQAEKTDLVAFLKTLTGDNIEQLTADARKARENYPIVKQDASDHYMESIGDSRP
ncbi:MAG: hypothetical protein BGO61_13650 [Thiobacillus sp. 65-69]|nr:hypothetical protein [Thiobacillus sp.]ODU87528.1 MAG: hypothetical protein ABT21_13340 [Thiobacillus sp. SCN 65-179]OJW38723.1 MAG: hypothetical protein BGO61_13650 [Thiobacillus sp. 65-69]